MKRLTESQARRCEEAREPRCRCRCGGALHGAARAVRYGEAETPREWFEALPDDDPHKVRELSATEKARRAKAEHRQKTRRHQLSLAFER